MSEFSFNREILRKIFHISTCIFPVLLYFYGSQLCMPYFFICGVLFISFDIARMKNHHIESIYNYFFSIVTKEYEYKRLTSASYVCLSILFVTFFFDEKIAIASLLLMSLSDPFASVFGRYFGSFKIYEKSLEGSIVFYIISCSVLIALNFSYSISIIVSLFCTVVELLSRKIKIDDNFLIPVTASFILFFLQYI